MKIDTGGTAFHCTLDGPAEAPCVMFSNSLATNLGMWEPQVAALGDRYRILRYDTRGHGASDVPPGPYAIEDLARDVVALLDRLEIARVHFVGLSLGGMTALALALDHAERVASITVANSMAVAPEGAEALWAERIARARADGMAALVEPTIARWFTPGFIEAGNPALARVGAMITATPLEGYAGCAGAITRMNLVPRLGTITTPTLAIAGLDDQATPPAGLRLIHEAVGGSSYVEIADASHLSNIEQAAAFTGALEAFLVENAAA